MSSADYYTPPTGYSSAASAVPDYANAADYTSPYSTTTAAPADSAYSSSSYGSYGSSTLAASDPEPTVAAPVVVSSSTDAAAPARPAGGSRVGAAFASLFIGLLLVGGAVELLGHFGSRLHTQLIVDNQVPGWVNVTLTSVGALLLFAAFLLNVWSPWATLLPGIAFTVAGFWALVSGQFLARFADIGERVVPRQFVLELGARGWLLAIGLMMLGGSVAVALARSSGRTRGRP